MLVYKPKTNSYHEKDYSSFHEYVRLSCTRLVSGLLPLADHMSVPWLPGSVLRGTKGHGREASLGSEASAGRIQLLHGGTVILHIHGGEYVAMQPVQADTSPGNNVKCGFPICR